MAARGVSNGAEGALEPGSADPGVVRGEPRLQCGDEAVARPRARCARAHSIPVRRGSHRVRRRVAHRPRRAAPRAVGHAARLLGRAAAGRHALHQHVAHSALRLVHSRHQDMRAPLHGRHRLPLGRQAAGRHRCPRPPRHRGGRPRGKHRPARAERQVERARGGRGRGDACQPLPAAAQRAQQEADGALRPCRRPGRNRGHRGGC